MFSGVLWYTFDRDYAGNCETTLRPQAHKHKSGILLAIRYVSDPTTDEVTVRRGLDGVESWVDCCASEPGEDSVFIPADAHASNERRVENDMDARYIFAIFE